MSGQVATGTKRLRAVQVSTVVLIAIGLDSDERDNPPLKFKEVYDKARSQGYHLTMHCDVDQENSVQHIWQCLDEIRVERVDHGVNARSEGR